MFNSIRIFFISLGINTRFTMRHKEFCIHLQFDTRTTLAFFGWLSSFENDQVPISLTKFFLGWPNLF